MENWGAITYIDWPYCSRRQLQLMIARRSTVSRRTKWPTSGMAIGDHGLVDDLFGWTKFRLLCQPTRPDVIGLAVVEDEDADKESR